MKIDSTPHAVGQAVTALLSLRNSVDQQESPSAEAVHVLQFNVNDFNEPGVAESTAEWRRLFSRTLNEFDSLVDEVGTGWADLSGEELVKVHAAVVNTTVSLHQWVLDL